MVSHGVDRGKLTGVYQIRNLNNNKLYIGSSSYCLRHRRNSHIKELRNNNHHSDKLQKSFNKHGEDAFVFEVLLYCAPDDVLMYEQLIMDFTEAVKQGYNITPTAGSTRGYKRTPEQLEKCRQNALNRPPASAETIEKCRTNMIKRMSDPDAREKATRHFKGVKTPEHIEKIKAAKKAAFENAQSDEDKAKRSAAVKRGWEKRKAKKDANNA